jgi:thioredoxin
VYCASGGRSGQAAQWLASNGFTQVENLKGGFNEWKSEKKPFDATANVVQLTIDQYYASLKSNKPVLVDFGAEWCPPCRKMQPVLDALQNEMKDKFKLVKVDGGINTAVMQQLDVSILPTFIVYKNGKEIWRKQGVVEKDELKKQLSK